MFKNTRFVILFGMLLNPSFKMTCFANAARTTANTSKFIHQERLTLEFTSANCTLRYIGETCYLKTKIEEQ